MRKTGKIYKNLFKPLSGYKPPKGLPVRTGPAKIGFFNSDEEGNIYDQKTGKLKFKVLARIITFGELHFVPVHEF